MAPGTEFARNFCAGIGSLQLGVVLVLYIDITASRFKVTPVTTHNARNPDPFSASCISFYDLKVWHWLL